METIIGFWVATTEFIGNLVEDTKSQKLNYDPDIKLRPEQDPLSIAITYQGNTCCNFHTFDDITALQIILETYHHPTVLDIRSGQRLLSSTDKKQREDFSNYEFGVPYDSKKLITNYESSNRSKTLSASANSTEFSPFCNEQEYIDLDYSFESAYSTPILASSSSKSRHVRVPSLDSVCSDDSSEGTEPPVTPFKSAFDHLESVSVIASPSDPAGDYDELRPSSPIGLPPGLECFNSTLSAPLDEFEFSIYVKGDVFSSLPDTSSFIPEEFATSTTINSKALLDLHHPITHPKDPGQLDLKDLIVENTVGEGACGLVSRVWIKERRKSGALKSIVKPKNGCNESKDAVARETRAMKMLVGDEAFVQLQASFDNEKYFFFLMEYYPNGDLTGEFDRAGKFPFEKAQFYAAELLLGIEKLHEMGIIHRDLKPANLLIDAEGHLVISDFGLCKILDITQKSEEEEPLCNFDCIPQKRLTNTACGTIEYMAPEVYSRRGYSFAADMWSFGVIVYEMFTDRFPFDGSSCEEIYAKAVQNEIRYEQEDPVDLTTETFIGIMLSVIPEERWPAPTARMSSFFDGLDWKKMEARQILPPLLTPAPVGEVQDIGPIEATEFFEYDPYYAEEGEDSVEFDWTVPDGVVAMAKAASRRVSVE